MVDTTTGRPVERPEAPVASGAAILGVAVAVVVVEVGVDPTEADLAPR